MKLIFSINQSYRVQVRQSNQQRPHPDIRDPLQTQEVTGNQPGVPRRSDPWKRIDELIWLDGSHVVVSK